MIEEQARVVAVADGIADVSTIRRSACGSCDAKGGCGTSILAAWFPQRQLRFRLPNHLDARPGDTVVVGLDEGSLQRASLVLYGLPLAGLVGGAVLGEVAARQFAVSLELGAVGGGLFGLLAALRLVRNLTAAGAQRGDNGVQLLRVVGRSLDFSLETRDGVSAANPTEGIRKVQ
jgi:sigma-E factor negative regulatory protein RseC